MARYYVNIIKQSNGDREVHKLTCPYFPSKNNYLGEFPTCQEAVTEAKKYYDQVNGCYYCTTECHSG